MEQVITPENMRRAYQRVVSNKGAPGADGMKVTELANDLKQHWSVLKERLLSGDYHPRGIRSVSIPKPQGGERLLGIPVVRDRLIQQALLQHLTPLFESNFSEYSFGFRPGKSAHQAVEMARSYVDAGYTWCVELDLEKFFDRVNHDILMSCIERRVEDKRILRLIRRYLEVGVMENGVTTLKHEGTPQGGPLSPLLSNILLNEFDKELEHRGHRFVRYADDVNIYVKSQKAGERVLESLTIWLKRKLKLTVNKDKSHVVRPWETSYLGYSITGREKARVKVSIQSLNRVKAKLRILLKSARGRNIREVIKDLNPLLRGWANYFRLNSSKTLMIDLDIWIRRKLRCALWRQWKTPSTRARKLKQLGLTEEQACRAAWNGRGPWWNAGALHMNYALPKKIWRKVGLISVAETIQTLNRIT